VRPVLALIVVAGAVSTARAGDPDDAFRRAAETMAAGDHAAAADAFEQIGRDYPDSSLADDALGKAAQLCEQRLGQIDRAIRLYQRVVDRYPRTRVARRAETRIAFLRRRLGDDPGDRAALSELEQLLGNYADRPRDQTISRMRALVSDYPDAPAAVEARLWLGGAYHADGWLDEALHWYREARTTAADPGVVARARKAEGDVLLSGGQWDDARRAYRSLYDTGEPMHALWADKAIERLDREERRARIAQLAWLVVGLALISILIATWRTAGSWRRAMRALARPPVEVYYLAPIALFVSAVSWRSNQLAAEAIAIVFAGALAVTWLSGAALETARRTVGRVTVSRALFHVAVAAAAILAICYIALMRERLLDLVVETWKNGPER
jgi:TolA-binding protein